MWNVVGVAAHQQRKDLHKSFAFALRACISEGVLYMNCLYGSHFQHGRLIPSLWQKCFDKTGSNIGLKLSELRARPSFRPVAYSISGLSVMLARSMFEDSSFLKKFPFHKAPFTPCG